MTELIADGEDRTGIENAQNKVTYSVLVDEMTIGGDLACESYGVKAVAPDGTSASVANITISISRIDELIELLRRNNVSPVHLRDVVEDWL